MEAIFPQHGRGIEGDVFSGRNSRIAAGHILARCGYGFRVHIGQYLTNQLLHCLPVYPWAQLRPPVTLDSLCSGSRH